VAPSFCLQELSLNTTHLKPEKFQLHAKPYKFSTIAGLRAPEKSRKLKLQQKVGVCCIKENVKG
jgi:hypothetical protein